MQVLGTSAIVTGGASGLGAATAAGLAAAGASVYVFDMTVPDRNAAIDGVRYAAVDVRSPDDVRAAVADVAAGTHPLRVVVNCAGIGPSARVLGKSGAHDLALYNEVVSVNLIGTFNVLALAAEQMAKTDADEHGQRGVIINTASVAAYEGQIGQAAYASSKGGIVGLNLPAARDLAQYGIRVMTIAPGIVLTPMLITVSEEFRAGLAADVPFPKRLGDPDDYCKLVLSIVDNDYLNGDVVRLDGALRMAPR